MRALHRGPVLLLGAVTTLLGACAFVTDFGDVTPLGAGGGTGASSSSGGGGPTCTEACIDCFAGAVPCPLPMGTAFVLAAPESVLEANAQTSVTITDAVTASNGKARFVGYFADHTGGSTFTVPEPPGSLSGSNAVGFLLDEKGTVLGAAGKCDDGDMPATTGNRVFFNGATAVLADGAGKIVVAGAFEAQQLRFYDATLDCTNASGNLDSPDDGTYLTPFLVWLREVTGAPDRSLEPGIAGGDTLGYLADVAALPGGSDGLVAAVGIASADPFTSATFGRGPQYYVVASNGLATPQVVPLEAFACDANYYQSLSGLRSSVAVHGSDQVWVAGTGCSSVTTEADRPWQGFLEVLSATGGNLSAGLPPHYFGDASNTVAISKLAVSESWVVVAGNYTGNPITLAGGAATPTGDDVGFVMAFPRADWSNDTPPSWFVRIQSDGGTGDVTGLVLDGAGDRLLVAGNLGAGGAIEGANACFTSTPLGRGRGFFAELDPATGGLQWLRVDGFEPAQPGDLEQRYALATAVVPIAGGVMTATSTHGEVDLSCSGGSTGLDTKPKVTVRTLLSGQ